MGRVKELWQSEIDRIGEDYFLGRITLEDSIISLKTLGYDRFEAAEYLDAVDELGFALTRKHNSPFTIASKKQGS